MSIESDREQLEASFQGASDQGFRARAVSEYKQITYWIGKQINLEEASILDFGCGTGVAAASFALRHPQSQVVGIDIEEVNEKQLQSTLQSQIKRAPPQNLRFFTVAPGEIPGEQKFDLIYAWSVFEHVKDEDMSNTFAALKQRLAPNGLLFIQVNPLYFSPQGSHLYRYFKAPWHHLVLSIDQIREGVLSTEFKPTEAREWRQFLELNRLTAQDILGRASIAGLEKVREQMHRTDVQPPPRLARLYSEEALMTTQLIAMFK